MSGFITTMFVSFAPNHNSHLSAFPAKPKRLEPIFTFAQSQSCLNLDMYAQEVGLGKDTWTEKKDGCFEAAPAKPPSTYKSPLQRIGEALRAQPRGATSAPPAGEIDLSYRMRVADIGLPPPTPQSSPKPEAGDASPNQEFPNYSYKLVPGGKTPPPRADLPSDCDDSSGQISKISPRNNGYFKGGSLLSSLFSSNPRTRAPFKPQKSNRGTSSWQLKQYAEATLGNGSLRKAVKLPEGEDKDEWLAVNVVDFYNQINLLYGSITEFCSPTTCPEMKATDEFEYLWQDNENYKKPTKMAAPEYVEHLMAWVQSNVDNEQMFPSRIGVPFPKTFPALLRNIFKRLYRVYAHIYCHHYPVIIELGLEPHLNTSFKHYVLFIDEHGLASGSKDFWGPLGDLVESMLRSD